MTSIVLQREALERDRGELTTVSTTLINPEVKKFPGRPIAVVRSVSSVAQTSAKELSTKARNYYLSQSLGSMFLLTRPYQLRTIDEQPEELRSDDIAVYALARSITGQNIGFTQASTRVKLGKFLSSVIGYLPVNFPQSPSKLEDSELAEEEPIWRGIFPLSHSTKVLFSKDLEVKVDELPAWKPRVVIDRYRLEDDDE